MDFGKIKGLKSAILGSFGGPTPRRRDPTPQRRSTPRRGIYIHLNICLLYNIRVNISVHNVFFFFHKIASFNPLAMILNQKLFDGNNFEYWKTNLYIVLDYEKIKFVFDTPKPAIPEAGANDITKTEHVTWKNANTSLRCCILTSVVGHLRQQ